MHRVRFLAVLIALVAATAVVVPVAAAPPDDCPSAVPTDEVVAGMTGVGVTVAKGTTRESFGAEVLGVMEDAVGVGRDVVIAELTGPPIDRVGGAWFGISGSPVHVGDRLLGATAYMLSGSTTIVGLTPGQDMLDLLSLPDGLTRDGGLADIPLDHATQRAIAAATGATASEVAPQGLVAMPVPLALSGLAPRRVADLREAVEARGLPLVPHAAASAGHGTSTTAEIRGGDNLGAAISYGDVTAAGIGTATVVCGDRVLGFGHPMMATGRTTLGASTATTVAVVDDPVFGSFELARLDDRVGTVDQDRGAGIRAVLGVITPTTPVTSDVTDVDTGVSRRGRTEVVLRDLVPDIALSHLLGNIDRVIDRFGPGSSTLRVTVRGQSRDGRFTYRRGNRFVSDVDVAFESLVELFNDLAVIQHNDIAPVTITEVDATASVREEVRRARIAAVEVSTDGVAWTPITDVAELGVSPGGRVHARVTLRSGQAERAVELALDVPRDISGAGFLEVRGGAAQFVDPGACLFDPAACDVAGEPSTLEELVAALQARPRNDDLVMALTTFPDGGPVGAVPPDGDAPVLTDQPAGQDDDEQGQVVETRARQGRVVTGAAGVPVVVRGEGREGGG